MGFLFLLTLPLWRFIPTHLTTQPLFPISSFFAALSCRYLQALCSGIRTFHTMDAPPKISITVIGGGPAGLAIVGNLLELKWQGSIVWIDRDFEGGCLNEYRQVPRFVVLIRWKVLM